jgi:nucleoside-diphosphate-sugar epimerase
MKILLTAADTDLGKVLINGLSGISEIRPIGISECISVQGYESVDLLSREAVEKSLKGISHIIHLLPYVARCDQKDLEENNLLDLVARSTYVLTTAASEASIARLVLLSRLDIMRGYDDSYIVDSTWQPRPEAHADSLAPHMAELVCREVARTGKISVAALRLGEIGVEVKASEAVNAIQNALSEPTKENYHWTVKHIASAGRFAL